MRVAIIGRSEVLYDTMLHLMNAGHEIVCILTSKEAPEYTRNADDYRRLAEARGIPFAQGPMIIEHLGFFKSVSADIAVSINYTGVVPQSVIDIFPLGVLNAHGGDLPRYRGNACQAWAILNGENRIGLCIHKMIGDELDSGDIIAREYLSIDLNTKIGEVWGWIVERTPNLMLEALKYLSKNESYILERQSKEPKLSLRCYPRRPEDGRIDWHRPAIEVLRLINASNKPYAGAYCELEGEKLIIWDANLIIDDQVYCAVPGQITAISGNSVEVACYSGRLRINAVEYDKKIITPAEIIRSIRTRLL